MFRYCVVCWAGGVWLAYSLMGPRSGTLEVLVIFGLLACNVAIEFVIHVRFLFWGVDDTRSIFVIHWAVCGKHGDRSVVTLLRFGVGRSWLASPCIVGLCVSCLRPDCVH